MLSALRAYLGNVIIGSVAPHENGQVATATQVRDLPLKQTNPSNRITGTEPRIMTNIECGGELIEQIYYRWHDHDDTHAASKLLLYHLVRHDAGCPTY